MFLASGFRCMVKNRLSVSVQSDGFAIRLGSKHNHANSDEQDIRPTAYINKSEKNLYITSCLKLAGNEKDKQSTIKA